MISFTWLITVIGIKFNDRPVSHGE